MILQDLPCECLSACCKPGGCETEINSPADQSIEVVPVNGDSVHIANIGKAWRSSHDDYDRKIELSQGERESVCRW